MTDRVAECVHPEFISCRGCSWSYEPSLFDGGCKLHYEKNTPEGAGKSPADTERKTTGQSHAEKRQFQKGKQNFLENREELS